MDDQELKMKFEEILLKYQRDPENPECQCNLACCYQWGIGTECNFTEAARLYELAKSQIWEASGNLGILYMLGQGVPKDEIKAAALLKVSAEHGDINAMANLGGLLLKSPATFGSQLGPNAGIDWLTKAAEGNHPVATHNLGMAYLVGRGVEMDLAKAVKLFEMGVDLGNEASEKVLKDLLEKGFITKI